MTLRPGAGGGGVTNFLGLADTPATYAGDATKVATVNGTEDGLEFVAAGAPGAHKDTHDPEDGGDPVDTAAASEIVGVQAAAVGSSHSLARADHGHAINHGIADNKLVTVDQADAASGEYVRLTANGIESRSEAEFKADVNLEIGTDVLAEQTVGIADNNLLEVDDAAAADNEFAKFTANGLEGRTYAEVRTDINVADGADVTGSNAPQAHAASHQDGGGDEISVAALSGLLADDQHVLDAEVISAAATIKLDDFATPDDNTDLDFNTTEHGLVPKGTNVGDFLKDDGTWASPAGGGTVDTSGTPVANDFARFTDADTIEGRSYAEVKADLDLEIGTDVLAEQTIGIADDNLLEVDGSPADNEYAKFTANGLEGRTYAELITDLALPITINFIIDGGGSAITTGIKGDVVVDFGCTITQVTMLADQSGSIVVDIWKDSYANFPPTDADTITAAAVPTITTAVKSQDSTLSGWTTAITAGDILRFNVDSITTCERVTISLKVTRT